MSPFGPVRPSLISFLEALRASGGLRFEYDIATHDAAPTAAQPPRTEVILSGPDTPLLLERNGELLHALESLAAAILRLEPDQAEQLSFDAAGFKAGREAAIARLAEEAVAIVTTSGKPYLFAPMNSRERRLLHLALVPSSLATASSGLGPRRFVVLYPAGQTPEPERFEQPARRPGPFQNQGNLRQGSGFRNQPGFRSPDPSRRLSPRSPQPHASTAPPPLEPGNAGDPDNRGNLSTDPRADDQPATDSRLDSIRRAFRKR